MSRLDAVLPRSAVRLNMVARYDFGDDPRRVVRVAVLEMDKGEDRMVARVFGLQGREVVLLDEQPVTAWHQQVKGRTTLTLADGREWALRNGGCACGSPLKRMDVTAEYRRA